LQAQLKIKENLEKPQEKLTSKQLLQKFIELDARPDDPAYKELTSAFAKAKQREEEETEIKNKQVEEDKKEIVAEVEENVVAGSQVVPPEVSKLSDEIAAGSLIPEEAKYAISNVEKVEKIVSDKDIYELEKRLFALEGRDIVQETQAKYEEALAAKEINKQYRLATKINANKGETGTIIGNTITGFFELSQNKERPTRETIKNINEAVKEIDDFSKLNKDKVFTFEAINGASPKIQRGIVRIYVLVLILGEISKFRGLQTYGLDRLTLDKTISFKYPFASALDPFFEKLSAVLYKTVASQKLVQRINDLNALFDKENNPIS